MVSPSPVNKLALLSLQGFRSVFLLLFLVIFELKPLLLMCCAHYHAATFKTQSCKVCASEHMHDKLVAINPTCQHSSPMMEKCTVQVFL